MAHVTSQTHTPKRQTHVSGTHVGYAIRIRLPDTHAEATVFAHALSMTRAVAGRAVGQLFYEMVGGLDDSLSPRWARVPPAGLGFLGLGYCSFTIKPMGLGEFRPTSHSRLGKPTSTTQLPTKHCRNPSVARVRSTCSTKRRESSTSARPALHQGSTNHQQPLKDQGARFIDGVAGDLAAGVFNPATHRCRVRTPVLQGRKLKA